MIAVTIHGLSLTVGYTRTASPGTMLDSESTVPHSHIHSFIHHHHPVAAGPMQRRLLAPPSRPPPTVHSPIGAAACHVCLMHRSALATQLVVEVLQDAARGVVRAEVSEVEISRDLHRLDKPLVSDVTGVAHAA